MRLTELELKELESQVQRINASGGPTSLSDKICADFVDSLSALRSGALVLAGEALTKGELTRALEKARDVLMPLGGMKQKKGRKKSS